ncbi:MAG: DNA mismatch repair protein MutS [Roseiflexaceae bacterium]|nr:DNA mismatch repair protein MutS [Roseiflexaceae bacterium]
MIPTINPEHIYAERLARFSAEREREQRRSDRNGNLSLVLLGLTAVLFGLWLWQVQPWMLAGAGLLALAFLASFIRHGGVNRSLARARELASISAEGLARLRRDWAQIPLHVGPPNDPAHPYADDLDISGRASLEHLLHTPTTPVGRETLRRWLLAPATPPAILRRQQAVAELAPTLELRDELALNGRLMAGAQRDYEQFLVWAEGEPWLLARPWLIWLSRGLALAALALLTARLLGLPVGTPLAAVLVANVLVYFLFARQVEQRIEQASARQEVYAAYAALFGRITTAQFAAPELVQLQQALAAHGLRADQQMRRLARRMPLAQVRTWMLFFPIQIATLWSFHVLWLLERWQREAGRSARSWLAALGEVEALAALATLHFDNPDWAFPELGEQPVLRGRALGHPLLPPSMGVGNDLEIGPPGTMLLVTGSNMSGKSTLLRAVGLNVVLAQAGGPACAQALVLPPVAVASSMRVRDSLESGVSYFMAELQRLKFVVDLAAHVREEGQRTPLFLLDEILHGTNSAERLVAARAILRHLLDLGATGAVSTHDLALADTPALADDSVLVHFQEHFSRDEAGPAMTFDYHLRPGLAQTTNALRLMELLGLPVK